MVNETSAVIMLNKDGSAYSVVVTDESNRQQVIPVSNTPIERLKKTIRQIFGDDIKILVAQDVTPNANGNQS